MHTAKVQCVVKANSCVCHLHTFFFSRISRWIVVLQSLHTFVETQATQHGHELVLFFVKSINLSCYNYLCFVRMRFWKCCFNKLPVSIFTCAGCRTELKFLGAKKRCGLINVRSMWRPSILRRLLEVNSKKLNIITMDVSSKFGRHKFNSLDMNYVIYVIKLTYFNWIYWLGVDAMLTI